MSYPRLPDWSLRLEGLIAAREAAPFAWGENDCATFACDCVREITGRDPADGLRDHRTEDEGAATLKANGGIRALADARLGVRIPPASAAPGDVGLVRAPGGRALVVCVGSQFVGPSRGGLARYPLDAVSTAWRAERA